MKITSKTLMLNIEHNISLAKGMIELTVIHQAFVYQGKDLTVDIDIELIDWENTKFMDMPVTNFKEFKTHLSGLGIDFDKMLDEACTGLFSNDDIEKLKAMYKV